MVAGGFRKRFDRIVLQQGVLTAGMDAQQKHDGRRLWDFDSELVAGLDNDALVGLTDPAGRFVRSSLDEVMIDTSGNLL